mmetsp:Transcript_33823/g.73164  ORF Transcript_33823/g.73164 Transcript_33823/m.73164 type:complete len:232 (+) Transcript_33823:108-803(+)
MAGSDVKWKVSPELRRRAQVFMALICFLAIPMYISRLACRIILFIGLTAAAIEWWYSAVRAVLANGRGLLQESMWLFPSFCAWLAPTAVFVVNWPEVVEHRRLMACIIIQLAVGDTAQLLCGRSFGRTRICGKLSPGKTLEGYVGGLIVTIAYGVVFHSWPVDDIVLCFIAGCIGDLFFSSVKRRLGIKDFSAVLSAHGGILDRLDSVIFALNALFWRERFRSGASNAAIR